MGAFAYRREVRRLALAAVTCAAFPAWAQTAASPPAAIVAPAVVVVDVKLTQAVSSKTSRRGDTFTIALTSPATIEGHVIPAGTPGVGQVVDAAPAGPLGRPAKLLLAARYLEFEGLRFPLRAFRIGVAGADQTTTILVGSFVPYAGLLAGFIKGGEIEVPAGVHGQAKLTSPPASAPPNQGSNQETKGAQ